MSLYTSASGREVNHASSSSLETYKQCRRKFWLNRVQGWKQKDKKASLEFGKSVEAAIQFYHENGLKPGECVDEFKRLWLKWAEQPLVYTDQEGNHSDLYRMGSDLCRLYEIQLPNLPIKNPKFQLQFSKALWPGTNLGELEFLAYIDILSTLEDGTRIIVDIKTAKSVLDVTPGMLSLDGQLRKYAWVSGIREVGFLNLVKARPSLKKGDSITLLEDARDWKAGTSLIVAKYDDENKLVYIGATESVRIMDELQKAISGKGATEKKEQVLIQLVAEGKLAVTSSEALTKTKLQFIRATIPEEELAGVGQAVGSDMLALRSSVETNFWPQDGGVKFPNQQCTWCEQRGHCLKLPDLVDKLLVNILAAPVTKETDWLSELESEETE